MPTPSAVVTLDGPAGAGKSSTARRLAALLGWRLLDTGAMYRAVALAALDRGCPLDDREQLAKLARGLRVRFPDDRVELDGNDVTDEVRSLRVTLATRYAADTPDVRAELVGWQRQFVADHRRVVTEGRDQGTIVFPQALLKIYLTAAPEARARRRFAEFAARGETITLDQVLADLIRRDQEDQARAVGALRAADDAIIFDTTDLSAEQVLDWLESQTRRRLAQAGIEP